MKKNIRISFLLVLLTILALTSLALQPAAPLLQDGETPTPQATRTKKTPQDLVIEAGNSDGIVVLGFLIVAIIFIPMFIRKRDW
jgi:hypothetical protein